MVNFGPVGAEIVSLVWGTPGNFIGFRVLAALLHGTLKPRLHDTTGCQSGLTTVLNEQPLFVQPGCTTGLTTGCIHDQPVVKRV